MGSLLHPVGGQPPRVYWARRAVLVVALVALIVVGFLLFRQPDPATTPAVPASTQTVSAAPTESASSSAPSETATATPTPAGPLVCDQTNTELGLAGYQKVKQDGKQSFKVAVKNRGGQPCVLDLAATNFVLTVTSGSDRIWSTADCAKWVPAKKQTLKAAQAYEFAIEWRVVRSAAGCKEAKSLLNPGTYVASAAFVEAVKGRQVFLVTKA